MFDSHFANAISKLRLTAFQCEMLDDRPGECVVEALHAQWPTLDPNASVAADDAVASRLSRGRDERGRPVYKPITIDCGQLSDLERLCLYDRFIGSTYCASLAPFSLGGQDTQEKLAYARAKRSMDKMATRYREAGFIITASEIPFY